MRKLRRSLRRLSRSDADRQTGKLKWIAIFDRRCSGELAFWSRGTRFEPDIKQVSHAARWMWMWMESIERRLFATLLSLRVYRRSVISRIKRHVDYYIVWPYRKKVD